MILTELIVRIREDLADGDDYAGELGVTPGEWCEVRRADVEALLRVADTLEQLELIDLPAADEIVMEATTDA